MFKRVLTKEDYVIFNQSPVLLPCKRSKIGCLCWLLPTVNVRYIGNLIVDDGCKPAIVNERLAGTFVKYLLHDSWIVVIWLIMAYADAGSAHASFLAGAIATIVGRAL
jgi:hypothetical protein